MYRSEGIAKVSVSFSCHFITSGGPKATYFDASQSLTVVPEFPLALGLPVTWVLPPFYTSSELLPGTSESHRQSNIHNKKTSIIYSLLSSRGKDGLDQQDAIMIAGTKIKTKGSNSLGCIQAKDQSGRRVIAACIRVAEVRMCTHCTTDACQFSFDVYFKIMFFFFFSSTLSPISKTMIRKNTLSCLISSAKFERFSEQCVQSSCKNYWIYPET